MKIAHKTIHSPLSHQAAALVEYAKSHSEFGKALANSCNFAETKPLEVHTSLPSPHLVPVNEEDALRRTQWLLEELRLKSDKHEQHAKAILAAWAKDNKDPQSVVLGIVGVAIIGPTLGLVKKKKKKKKGLRVVLTQAATNKTTKEIVEISQHTALSLLSNELQAVDGNAYRLNPEMADWLFSEQETTLSTMNTIGIADLATWLKDEALPHYTLESNGKVVAIAVSPCVNESLTLGEEM